MSQSNAFFDVLNNRSRGIPDPRRPVIDVLERFRAGIEMFYGGRLDCAVEPGFPTTYGQEYKMVVRSVGSGFEHTLFRTYVPATGLNVRLDSYDYSITVLPDAAALEGHLVLLLQMPQMQDALDAYAK